MTVKFLITSTHLQTDETITMQKTLKQLIGSDFEKYGLWEMRKNQSVTTKDELFFSNSLTVITRIM